MTPLRERNQVLVALVGTASVLLLVLFSVNLDALPFVNSTNTYYADLANADGLKSGDDVRVEGISVGSVDDVSVQGDHVHVEFSIDSDVSLGGQSRASVEVATVLGNLFLQLESAGPGTLAEDATIPVTRTTVPYTLLDAFDAFGRFSQQTDLPRLRVSLETLARTVSGIAPADAKAALNGLADVATTLAGKQAQISDILTAADAITSTLNRNSAALVSLLVDGQQFLRLVEARHAVISALLRDTAALGAALDRLFARNGAQLSALLRNLDTVTHALAGERDALQRAIVNLGQFSINITNSTGDGPWVDLFSPVAVVPDNQIKGCGTDPAAQKRPCSP